MCPLGEELQHSYQETNPRLDSLHDSLRSAIPLHASCGGAFDLAASLLPPAIFNHSFRVYLYAKHLVELGGSAGAAAEKPHLLFTACILHDIGTVKGGQSRERFEVVGADTAVAYLQDLPEVDREDQAAVWQAIALHTSPGIAERMEGITRLVRLAVLIDFGNSDLLRRHGLQPNLQKTAEAALPRLGIEKVLGDAVVRQAEVMPEKAPAASWPGVLLRSKQENPDWTGVNKAF